MDHLSPHRMAGSWLEYFLPSLAKSKNQTQSRFGQLNRGAVKYAGAAAQIAAVRQQNAYAAENADSRLNPGVEEPFL
jgi:hypothetical protein